VIAAARTPIGYSTNVHPGRTLDEAIAEVERVAPAVRARLIEAGSLDANDTLELGLWLSANAAQELRCQDDAVERLCERFARRGLRVRALNGFPYAHFHADRVKHSVYHPSWSDAARLIFTQTLAEIMARFVRCGPPPAPGTEPDASISTVPLGWRSEIAAGLNGAALGAAAANLEQLVRFLASLEGATGVRIHVDLEPEPGCFLDTSRDVVEFFERVLRPRRGDPDRRRYLGVCHDVCHAAVMWETQAEALARYRDAGIRVGRLQLSSALEARGAEERARLFDFDEARYLHQTTLRGRDGRVTFFEDLPQARATVEQADASFVVRSHFHVPLADARANGVGTTRAEVEACLRAWPASEPLPAIEVETYTWSVMPAAMRREALADGIAAELRWALDAVRSIGAETAATPDPRP